MKDVLLANKFKLVFYLGTGLLGRGIGQYSNLFPLATNRLKLMWVNIFERVGVSS